MDPVPVFLSLYNPSGERVPDALGNYPLGSQGADGTWGCPPTPAIIAQASAIGKGLEERVIKVS